MDEILSKLNAMAEIAYAQSCRELIQNLDNSRLDANAAHSMLNTISKIQYFLDVLISQCDSIGGFGKHYPKECRINMKTLKTILEMEIKEKTDE
jgi:hypothetical protein